MTTEVDYSQTGEWEYLKNLPQVGRFLEIGAYDGKTFSNVRGLLERGWTGVMVEPAAYCFDLCVQNALPGVELVNCLLGDTTGIVPFWYSRDAVSTTEEENMERWKHTVSFAPVYVSQVSIDDFMRVFPPSYNLVNIDTEGTSLRLLELLKPYLGGTEWIVVEHDGHTVSVDGFREAFRSVNNVILERA